MGETVAYLYADGNDWEKRKIDDIGESSQLLGEFL